jgi:hypothetical protein
MEVNSAPAQKDVRFEWFALEKMIYFFKDDCFV